MGPNDEDSLTKSSLASIWKAYAFPIILGSVSIVLILVSVVILIKSTQSTTPIRFSTDSASDSARLTDAPLTVDVQGAVSSPGVYTMPWGSRIEDAIRSAGGLRQDADIQRIAQTVNRAAKVVDGAKLYFPSVNDAKVGTGQGVQSESVGSTSNGSINLINVNMATQSELESLSGIGPVTAKKIINARPYQTLEELLTKQIIGQALYNKIKDNITL